jgi:membrane associated rhomboid family serine protease
MRTAQDFGFPPFTRTVKLLVITCVAIWFGMFLLGRSGQGGLAQTIVDLFALTPTAVLHGWVWQLVTYSFLHAGLGHVFFNMLSLWMFGSQLEQDWGRQRFLEFYFFSILGGALCTMAISYGHVLGLSPQVTTLGASGGIYGLIVAFGVLYSRARIYVMGIFPIEARWFAIIWVALALYSALAGTGGNIAQIAHLGGALFGYIYLKALPRRGLKFATSEGYYGIRNRYQRWKRRRMAKKFEVFMKQHDRKQYFDEYGNYRAPSEAERKRDEENGKGSGSGWVN